MVVQKQSGIGFLRLSGHNNPNYSIEEREDTIFFYALDRTDTNLTQKRRKMKICITPTTIYSVCFQGDTAKSTQFWDLCYLLGEPGKLVVRRTSIRECIYNPYLPGDANLERSLGRFKARSFGDDVFPPTPAWRIISAKTYLLKVQETIRLA